LRLTTVALACLPSLRFHLEFRSSSLEFMKPSNKGAAANRRYAGQLNDFMKFDCQDCIWTSRSAAVAELKRKRVGS
jgi:hypothetical protein